MILEYMTVFTLKMLGQSASVSHCSEIKHGVPQNLHCSCVLCCMFICMVCVAFWISFSQVFLPVLGCDEARLHVPVDDVYWSLFLQQTVSSISLSCVYFYKYSCDHNQYVYSSLSFFGLQLWKGQFDLWMGLIQWRAE